MIHIHTHAKISVCMRAARYTQTCKYASALHGNLFTYIPADLHGRVHAHIHAYTDVQATARTERSTIIHKHMQQMNIHT